MGGACIRNLKNVHVWEVHESIEKFPLTKFHFYCTGRGGVFKPVEKYPQLNSISTVIGGERRVQVSIMSPNFITF